MRLRSFIPLAILFFLLLTGGIYAFVKYIQPHVLSRQETDIQPIAKDEKVVICQAGDDACNSRNDKIKINKLSGSSVISAKHQCDGPHACPTPEPDVNNAAIVAIRSEAKNTNLELLRMTGINAKDQVYYCTSENDCWIYNVKTKKVISHVVADPNK